MKITDEQRQEFTKILENKFGEIIQSTPRGITKDEIQKCFEEALEMEG